MTPMAVSMIVYMSSSLLQPVASSLINAITQKGVMSPAQEGGYLSLLALPLMMKVFLMKQEQDTIK